MSESLIRRCSWCNTAQPVEFRTDGQGHLKELPLSCGCSQRASERTCVDCGSSELQGRSKRCEPCKREAQNAAARRWRERNPEKVAALEKARRSDPVRAQRIREREREHRRRPEVRSRRLEQRRRHAVTEKGRQQKAEQHRRYKAKYPNRVKAQQDTANRRRACAKREYMHRYATKYVGSGTQPTCRECGSPVEWGGRGRPRSTCDGCRGAS